MPTSLRAIETACVCLGSRRVGADSISVRCRYFSPRGLILPRRVKDAAPYKTLYKSGVGSIHESTAKTENICRAVGWYLRNDVGIAPYTAPCSIPPRACKNNLRFSLKKISFPLYRFRSPCPHPPAIPLHLLHALFPSTIPSKKHLLCRRSPPDTTVPATVLPPSFIHAKRPGQALPHVRQGISFAEYA